MSRMHIGGKVVVNAPVKYKKHNNKYTYAD
jgi:hypothetical protein